MSSRACDREIFTPLNRSERLRSESLFSDRTVQECHLLLDPGEIPTIGEVQVEAGEPCALGNVEEVQESLDDPEAPSPSSKDFDNTTREMKRGYGVSGRSQYPKLLEV